MSENKVQLEERLNKYNFEEWEFLISNILKSKKILKYIQFDLINNLKFELTGLINKVKKTDEDLKAIKSLESKIDEAEAKDALACTIISTNVSKEILEYIKRLSTSYEIMQKLRSLYGKKKSSDVQYWLKKLYSLRAKDLSDCKDTINQIKEIFEIMEGNNATLGEWEKIRILYLSFPKNLRDQIHPDGTENVDDFIKEALNKINFQIYLHSTIDYNKNIISNNDFMDIDYINHADSNEKDISYISKFKNNSKQKSNYCHICKVTGHSTDNCKYNSLTKNKNSKKSTNKSKISKTKQNKNNKKHDFNKNYKTLDNLEYSEELSENETSFENLKSIYNSNLDNIETIDDYSNDYSKNKKLIRDQKNNEYSNEPNIALVCTQDENNTIWTFDTGASEHITNNKDILKNFKEEKITLRCANNSLCEFEGIGTYEGTINGYNIILENVLYSKHINKNLLSGIKLAKNGMKCNLKARKGKVFLTLKTKNNKNRTVNIGTFRANKNNTIHIQSCNNIQLNTIIDNISYDTQNIDDQTKLLWHRRLGHFYNDNLTKYLRIHNIKTIECFDCKIAKLNRKPHNRTTPKATQILETIHSDVIGPIQKSATGKRYILTFIDEYSRKSWIFLLESKSIIPRTIINFFIYLNNQFNYKIKNFHSDQGTEYNNKKVLNFCKENGIVKTFSPPYNPQNNGKAERFNYTIVNCAKTLLQWSKMDNKFWDYAIKYSNLLYNLTPHKGLNNKIPNEIFYKKKVDLKYIKVFGCIAFYKDFSQTKMKFQSNAKKGVFVGFNIESNCYIIMDYDDHSIHFVREAVFDEHTPSAITSLLKDKNLPTNIFNNDNYIYESPLINTEDSSDNLNDSSTIYIENSNNDITELTPNIKSINISNNNNNNNSNINNNNNNINNNNDINNNNINNINNNNDIFNNNNNTYINNNNSDSNVNINDTINDKFNNNIDNKINDNIDDKINNNIDDKINDNIIPHSLKRKSSLNTSTPLKKIDNKNYDTYITPLKRNNIQSNNTFTKKFKFTPNPSVKRPGSPINLVSIKKHKQEINNIDNNTFSNIVSIPKTYRQAINSIHRIKWEEAMNSEISNFFNNCAIKFVKHIPNGRKAITSKWVYAIKRDGDGNVTTFKARIVARGFDQIKGTDYDLTNSPTLYIDSLKLIIAIASKFDWNIMQLDIKAAYLNAPIDKEIYLTIPPGAPNYGRGYWKLEKAVYGLKQSGRQWYITFTKFLIKNNFIQLISEPCIFKKMKNNKVVCIIGIYVDDLLITGIKNEIFDIINKIKNNFKVSKCNEADYILGIKIEKNKIGYTISQTQLINDILQKFNVTNIRKAKTPCTGDNMKLENDENFDKTTYKSAVGSLIYLGRCTRPDISFAIGKAARHSENPKLSDWKKVINILKYLNYTKNYKINYKGKGELVGYTDSDFGGDPKDRKSTSGYIILMEKDPICWQSKKQTVVATSTCEAEYIAMAECTKKALSIRNILIELFNYKKPFKIYTDNLASKTVIENGELNNRLKHIDIKFYFNKDNIQNNKISLEYINTEKMLADPLTKDINGPKMCKFTDQIFDKQ